MTRRARLALTLAAAGAALAAFTSFLHIGVAAATRPDATDQASGIEFTRIQTITLVTSPSPTVTNLATFWENLWVDVFFPVGFPLPGDYMSLTVSGGTGVVSTTAPLTTVFGEVYTYSLSLTPNVTEPLYVSYYTNSRAAREGNQFRIFIRATGSGTQTTLYTYTYTTTVAFGSPPYEFVNYEAAVPTDTLPVSVPYTATIASKGYVGWGGLTVKPGDRIDRYVALGDIRLPLDLMLKNFGVSVSPDKTSVQVTATIINSGTVPTGNFLLVELYDKPAGSPPPTGPNDHLDGACLDAQCSFYRWFSNLQFQPAGLLPGATLPFTFNYAFHTGGFRDLYLQIDSFGGSSGFNLEPGGGEFNNIALLATVQAVGRLYLPTVLKNR